MLKNKYKPEIRRSTCGRKLQEELLLSVLTNETPTRNKNNNVIYIYRLVKYRLGLWIISLLNYNFKALVFNLH